MMDTVEKMTNTLITIQNATSSGIMEQYESSSGFWTNIADACATLVVIGIFAELLELAPKVLKSLLEFNCAYLLQHKPKIESLLKWFKKYESRIDLWGFFFWMVIVVALAGELMGTRIAHHFDSLTIGYLNNEAKNALAVASSNELRVEELRQKNNELELQIAHINANDTLNFPVYSISGVAGLTFNGSHLPMKKEISCSVRAVLWSFGPNSNSNASPLSLKLHSVKAVPGEGKWGQYSFSFDFKPLDPDELFEPSRSGYTTAKMLANSIDRVSIFFDEWSGTNFSWSSNPTSRKVLLGSAIIYLNDRAVREFKFGEGTIDANGTPTTDSITNIILYTK
jgi:hypothetical protein